MPNNDLSGLYITQLDALLNEYEQIKARRQYSDYSGRDAAEATQLGRRLLSALERISGPGFTQDAAKRLADRDHIAHDLDNIAALASSVRDDIKAGWATSIVELIHADTSADILDVAQTLQDGGFKDAAAVIAGTALELHLRALSVKASVTTTDTTGRYKKADTLKAELVKEGTLTKLQEKQINYWLGIRNSAAHGLYQEYTKEDVNGLMSGVTTFIDSYPA